jgi:hypothetical protein
MLRNFMTISLVSLVSALNCRELRNAQELPLYRATNEALRNRHEERIIFLRPGQGTVEYMLEKNMKENAHDRVVRQSRLPTQHFAAWRERLCQPRDLAVQQFVPKVPEQRRDHALYDFACSIREFDGIPQAGRERGGNNQQRGNQYFFHRTALPTFEFAAAATLKRPRSYFFFSNCLPNSRARSTASLGRKSSIS